MSRYSSSGDGGGQVNEFKHMVKAFHAGGIEVILDGGSSDGSADDELSHQQSRRKSAHARAKIEMDSTEG